MFSQRHSLHIRVIRCLYSFLFSPKRCILYTLFNTLLFTCKHHLGGCSTPVHKEQLHFLHLHNITSCRWTVIYLSTFYSQSLVATNSAAMNKLSRLRFGRCTGVSIFLVLLPCPPVPAPTSPPTPSVGAEEGGHGAGSLRQKGRCAKLSEKCQASGV